MLVESRSIVWTSQDALLVELRYTLFDQIKMQSLVKLRSTGWSSWYALFGQVDKDCLVESRRIDDWVSISVGQVEMYYFIESIYIVGRLEMYFLVHSQGGLFSWVEKEDCLVESRCTTSLVEEDILVKSRSSYWLSLNALLVKLRCSVGRVEMHSLV